MARSQCFARAREIAHDHRHTTRHRFEHGGRQPVRFRHRYHRCSSAVQRQHQIVRDCVQNAQAGSHAVRLSSVAQRTKVPAIGAAPRHHDGNVRREHGERRDHNVRPVDRADCSGGEHEAPGGEANRHERLVDAPCGRGESVRVDPERHAPHSSRPGSRLLRAPFHVGCRDGDEIGVGQDLPRAKSSSEGPRRIDEQVRSPRRDDPRVEASEARQPSVRREVMRVQDIRPCCSQVGRQRPSANQTDEPRNSGGMRSAEMMHLDGGGKVWRNRGP